MKASDSVTYVKGVGEAVASNLAKLRIQTILDLVDYVPRRYDDYSKIIRVSQIRPGPVTLRVKIGSVSSRYSRKGLHMTEALASDESGSVKLVWFNQPYRKQSIKLDVEYFVSGEFAQNYRFFAITNPACELVSSFPVNTARLIPQYRLTKGLGSAQLRKIMKTVLTTFTPAETLPEWLLEQEDLMPKASALMEMHFPDSHEALKMAKNRLGFEEIFELTLASELNKESYKNEHALEIPFNEDLIKNFVESLPFSLTNDQRRVAWAIFQDMSSGSPMNRLVEGDVGSGKTVVAVLAAIGAMQAGFQVAFMAPTELLANQHATSLHELLQSVGFHEKLLLLTGSMSKSQKEVAYSSIKSGEAQLIIGTHALFQDKVVFDKLGLLIVDEQHRFGVEQRKKLQAKAYRPVSGEVSVARESSPGNSEELLSEREVLTNTVSKEKGPMDAQNNSIGSSTLPGAGFMPHVLNMTATPIPRSLALTLYGEMDVSIIAELPPGRKQVETELFIPENREKVYREVASEIHEGRQAFVVCPQIEEDEAGRLSVKKIHAQLSKKWLKNYKVALLHGKMTSQEKDEIMKGFVNGSVQVLVATTVIEVGVNVPNASVMVIEGADRFGLAQLHQLRGRVGRGSDRAYCYLILEDNSEPSARLKLLERENNGFKLAEYDLEIRGPGAIYGTMQHGELDLRVAKLTDTELITSARAAAKQFIAKGDSLLKYPQLKERVDRLRTITNLN